MFSERDGEREREREIEKVRERRVCGNIKRSRGMGKDIDQKMTHRIIS